VGHDTVRSDRLVCEHIAVPDMTMETVDSYETSVHMCQATAVSIPTAVMTLGVLFAVFAITKFDYVCYRLLTGLVLSPTGH
jgi:hypothetical protein